ncbi:MAG: hypothetical protein ACT4PW_11070 [Acidimicrobiia bacterium]
MRTRARLALIAASVILPVSLVVAAVVAGSEGGPAAPGRLPLAARGQAQGTALAASGDAAAGAESARYPYPGWAQYQAGPDLPALTGSARAYRLPAAAVTEESVRQLAAALGVDGDLQPVDGGGWEFGRPGEGGHLFVNGDGSGSWYFTDESVLDKTGGSSTGPGEATCSGLECTLSSRSVGTPCAEPGPDASAGAPVCADVVPTTVPVPADLPSAEQAEAITQDLLAAAGMAVDGAEAHVWDNSPYEMSVQVDPLVDGMPTYGFGAYVSIGDQGVVQYANGYLGQPEPADEYPLTGTAAAIDRLNLGNPLPWAGVALMSGAGGGSLAAPISPSGACWKTNTGEEGCTEGSGPALGGPGSSADHPLPACAPATSVTSDGVASDVDVPGYECGVDDGWFAYAPRAAVGSSAPAAVPATTLLCDATPVYSSDGGVSVAGCPGSGAGVSEPARFPEPPPPEPVVLNDARVGLMVAAGATGRDAWLVPVYLFDGGETYGTVVAAAVADEYLPEPLPVTDLPLPEPVPLPAVDPIAPVTTEPLPGRTDPAPLATAVVEPGPPTPVPLPAPVAEN